MDHGYQPSFRCGRHYIYLAVSTKLSYPAIDCIDAAEAGMNLKPETLTSVVLVELSKGMLAIRRQSNRASRLRWALRAHERNKHDHREQ